MAESSQIVTKNDVQNQKKYNENQKHLAEVEADLVVINAAKALLVNSPYNAIKKGRLFEQLLPVLSKTALKTKIGREKRILSVIYGDIKSQI